MEQAIIVLVIVGFLMIAAEVFVPGLVLGMLGGLCLVASVILCYVDFGPLIGTVAAAGLMVFTIVGLFVWLNVFPRTPLGKKLLLRRPLESNNPDKFSSLIGAEGQSLTPLRPAGTALINGRRVDVVTESDFIEAGKPIEVIFQEGVRVVVRAKGK